jgi:pimeloyl-ACP methyl ester carboxylesterase
MNWILSNRLCIVLASVAAIVAGYSIFPSGLLRCSLIAIGVIAILSIAVCLYRVAVSSPGGQGTVVEGEDPTPTTQPAAAPESLRLTWDSEAHPNWPMVEILALMSQAAYLPPVKAEPNFRALGFSRIEPVFKGLISGYVVSFEDVTVVTFRGTDDKLDWFVNLDEAATPTAHGEAHQGFYSGYQSIKDQITAVLAQTRPKHLWITGHSLGGALALVCAYDLLEVGKLELDGVITFGQPMVASKQLAAYLDRLLFGRYAHFVNEADIVPRVPPPPYAHCGSLVWFNGGGIRRSERKKLALAAAGAEGPTQDNVLPQISKEEFEAMKAGLRKNEELNRLPKGARMIGENIPWLRDHDMNLYLEKVRGIFRNTGST